MRITFAIAAMIGTLGATSVEAGEWKRVGYYPGYAVRAPQVIVYDDEVGTGLRAYWARPYQGRHYYPFTGKKPKVGRHEDLNAPRRVYPPAKSYYQEWSTLSLYPPHGEMPPADVAPYPIAPPVAVLPQK